MVVSPAASSTCRWACVSARCHVRARETCLSERSEGHTARSEGHTTKSKRETPLSQRERHH
eukprot:3663217-Rhodomonas_salina.1